MKTNSRSPVRRQSRQVSISGRITKPAASAELIEQTRQLMEQTIDFVPHPDFETPDFETSLERDRPSERVPTEPASSEPGIAFVSGLVHAQLLTQKEERFLFLRLNYLKSRAEQNRRLLDLRRPDQNLVDRIQRDLDESAELRNRVVLANLRLIVATAKKLTSSLDRMSELISEGMTPLIRAVELFDVGLGNRFSTYATWAVRNQMLRWLKKVRQCPEFTPGEDAPSLENLPEKPKLPDAEEPSPHNRARVVNRLLSSLSERERSVVIARFGLEGQPHGQSLAVIAAQIGLSKERVRQILLHSLTKLKSKMTTDDFESLN